MQSSVRETTALTSDASTMSFNTVPSSTETSVLPGTIQHDERDAGRTCHVHGIRHGQSVSNVWMTGDNAWGAPTYDDTQNIPDAPLSAQGIAQAKALCESLRLESTAAASHRIGHDDEASFWLDHVELIVVSPLTRCLQTYQYAIEPLLRCQRQRQKRAASGAACPVVVQPLLAERLYSVSETGRPLSVLQRDFASSHELDWSLLESNAEDDSMWWYHAHHPASEWRPHGQGQNYGSISGEPLDVFERRLHALHQWLVHDRPETNVLTVAHWGVYRHLAHVELDNCQVCSFVLQDNTNSPTLSSL